jgi:hypothetical protein
MFFNKEKKTLDYKSLRRKSLDIVDKNYSTKYINNIVVKMARATLQLWHDKLGHVNVDTIMMMGRTEILCI